MINTDIKLPKPDKYYGAIYGRNNHKQDWLIVALIATFLTVIASTITTLLITTATNSLWVFGIGLTVILAATALVAWVANRAINYNLDNYQKDIKQGRTQYAKTVFKQWVQQRYEIEITENQAITLMNGSSIVITHNNKKRTVHFKRTPGSKKLFETGNKKYTNFKDTKENWDYDTNKIEFQLVIHKKQKPVKEKIWQ